MWRWAWIEPQFFAYWELKLIIVFFPPFGCLMQGLNPFMFIFALLGNTTYVARYDIEQGLLHSIGAFNYEGFMPQKSTMLNRAVCSWSVSRRMWLGCLTVMAIDLHSYLFVSGLSFALHMKIITKKILAIQLKVLWG